MSIINQTTFIAAPAERVFDLARNVSLRKQVFLANDIMISGEKTTGFLQGGETLTLQFKLLFKQRSWKLKVVNINKPDLYVEEQVEGFLKSFRHEHYFKPCENGSFLIDQINYELKNGVAGVVADKLVYQNYLLKLLEIKNSSIKQTAESGRWKQYV